MSKISSLFKDDRTRLAQLDPRTKILLTITVSTILISSGSSQSILRITITLCSLSLLLSIYKYLAFFKFTMLFVILMLLQAYVVPYTHGMLQFILLACVGIFMNMLPGFIVGYFTLYSTKVSEFIAAMEKVKT